MKNLQLIASHKTLENYIKEHNNLKLDKFINLYSYPEFQTNIIESFDKIYSNTKYKIVNQVFNKEYSNYKNGDVYQIFFETNSNKNITSDFVWSISFTLKKYDINSEEYEKLTELYEEKEVLIRVGDILNQLNIEKNFVIGKTIDPRKMNLYKNILLYVFKNYNIELDYCKGMIDNKGLYVWK